MVVVTRRLTCIVPAMQTVSRAEHGSPLHSKSKAIESSGSAAGGEVGAPVCPSHGFGLGEKVGWSVGLGVGSCVGDVAQLPKHTLCAICDVGSHRQSEGGTSGA